MFASTGQFSHFSSSAQLHLLKQYWVLLLNVTLSEMVELSWVKSKLSIAIVSTNVHLAIICENGRVEIASGYLYNLYALWVCTHRISLLHKQVLLVECILRRNGKRRNALLVTANLEGNRFRPIPAQHAAAIVAPRVNVARASQSQSVIQIGCDLEETDKFTFLQLLLPTHCSGKSVWLHLHRSDSDASLRCRTGQTQPSVLVLPKGINLTLIWESKRVESPTVGSYNLRMHQIFNQVGRVAVSFKSVAKTSIGSIAPRVQFTRLGHDCVMTFSRGNLTHAQICTPQNLLWCQLIVRVTQAKSTLTAAPPRIHPLVFCQTEWVHISTRNLHDL